MELRNLKITDLEKIDNLYNKYYNNEFGLPSIHNSLTAVIAEEDNEFIAFGMMSLVPELIMVMDKKCSLRNKSMALKKLIEHGIIIAKNNQFNQLVASTNDINYSNLLTKHFNFKVVKDISLALNLE